MTKKKLKYVLYRSRANSTDGKIVDSGTTAKPISRQQLVAEMNETYCNA